MNKIIEYQKNGVIGFVDNDGEIYNRLKNNTYEKYFDDDITIIKIKPNNIDDMEKSWKVIYKDISNNL